MPKFQDPDPNASIQDQLKDIQAQLREEREARKRAEREAAKREQRQTKKASGKGLPLVCKIDNWLHDLLGQPRNYDI